MPSDHHPLTIYMDGRPENAAWQLSGRHFRGDDPASCRRQRSPANSGCLLLDVAAGGALDRGDLGVAGLLGGSSPPPAVRGKPADPGRPPAAGDALSGTEPAVRIGVEPHRAVIGVWRAGLVQ